LAWSPVVSLCKGDGLRLIAVLACIWALAACGHLPRPFQPADKSLPDIAEKEIGKRAGIFVQPIVGLEAEESEHLTEALVKTLHAEDVAASRLARNQASLSIFSYLTESGGLRWLLTAPDGEILFGSEGSRDLAGARRTARLLADFLQPPPATPRLALAVPAIDGAPGDGRDALASAMRQALAAKGFTAVEGLEDATYIVLGSVYVGAIQLIGQEKVEVDWTVLALDGLRLGTVSQSSNVPAGTLDGRWGAVARIVAENGAQGVVAMLTRLGVLE